MQTNIKTTFLAIFVLFFINKNYSQKTCKSKEESLEDINTVSKCSISSTILEKNSKSSGLDIKVSATRRLYKKNRNTNNLNLKALSIKFNAKEVKLAKRFKQVDEVPSFSKCTLIKGTEKLNCFNSEMVEHIKEYFYYPSDAIKKGIEDKIWVRFIIDRKGNVGNIKTIGNANINSNQLKDAVKYVIAKLPKFSPAFKDGRPVAVKYGFPIDFSLKK